MSNNNKNLEEVKIKARYWSFYLYPESAPEDWIDRIQMTGLPFCISPLHDKDTNPTGELKKAHYHIILCYNGPTTWGNVKKTITDPLNQRHPQYLNSVKGMYRYLTHQDNPEKYQYNPQEIRHLNGFTTADYCDMSITDEDRLFDAIENYIEDHELTEFRAVVYHLKAEGAFEMLSFFRRHTVYFKEFIRSARFGGFEKFPVGVTSGIIDLTTGEKLTPEQFEELRAKWIEDHKDGTPFPVKKYQLP